MTDTDKKKPSPTTLALLDAVFETTGIYRRDPPGSSDVFYDYAWPTAPLTNTQTALTHSAQAPLLKLLATLLVPDPAPKRVAEGPAPVPARPVLFRVHKDIPFGFHVTDVDPPFDTTIAAIPAVDGKPSTVKLHPLHVDAVLMLPARASLDPSRHALPPSDEKYAPPPTLLARVGLARLVDGSAIATLDQPIEAALELNLAHKPDTTKPPPFFAGVVLAAAIPHGKPEKPALRLRLRDAAYVSAATDAARAAATREVAWTIGDSPVLPLVRTALLVLRRWVVWLTEKNPVKPGVPSHFSHRLKDHLFPLVEGTGPGAVPVLPAFPLDALRPDASKLGPWLKGFLEPAAIVAVLYHLRALLTGKDDKTTAPGSAIAWLTDRTGSDDRSAPRDRDFGLVARTRGDAARGDAALGLRGQHSWKAANDTVRIGLALEGELVGAAWDLDVSPALTQPKASARVRARTGAAHLFLVVEPIDPRKELLAAGAPGLADLGALVRLEFGATLSPAGLVPEVRVTLRKGDAPALARSLVREILDLKDALEARAKAELENAAAAVTGELQALVATLKAELAAAVDAVAAATAAFFTDGTLSGLLDTDVKDALLDLLNTTHTKIQQKLAALDPNKPAPLSLDLADLVDATKLRAVLTRSLAWARTVAGQALGAIPQDLTLDLGPAELRLTADVAENTYRAALTVKPDAFPADLPLRLLPGTAITLSHTGLAPTASLTLTAGLELAQIEGLPFTPAVRIDLDSQGRPTLAVELRKTGAAPVAFPLIRPVAAPADLGALVVDLLRPLLDLGLGQLDAVLADLNLADGLSVATLLDLFGLRRTNGGWSAPDPQQIARALLQQLTPLARRAADAAAAATGLGFDPMRLTLTTRVPLAVGDGPVAFGVDTVSLSLLDGGDKLAPTLAFEKLGLRVRGQDGAPAVDAGGVFSIGSLDADVSAAVYPPALKSVGLQLRDIRLPLGSGGGDGAADLLPSGKENPGFHIDLGWQTDAPSGFYARFPGSPPTLKLDIDRVIGPIDVKRLTATLSPENNPTAIALGLDATFALGGVTITPQGLGVTIPFKKIAQPGEWIPSLKGLALGFSRNGVTIAGALTKTDTGFAGQATIKAFEFQLGALAAYDKMGDGTASLAVFGVLRMTLGGPPFFVVTGVAGGLGVNRGFERPRRTEELKDNPLLATMQGDKPLDLAAFRKGLAPKAGAFWLAGGVKFVSYGFIRGDALLYILLDGGFELGLLALASMEIPALVRVNLAIEAGLSFRGPEPTLYAKAALYDSWLLHPDCRITGGFALQVWPTVGDAVITLGGYHPAFKRPDRYPEVERLGFRWKLPGIQIKGGCYFAMTPREAMGGGRLEVEGQWGPLSAGFYAGVDGLFRWDPFYFDLNIEVGVWGAIDLWFAKLRFSLGVGLHIWGPPIGGVAEIDLGVTSLAIPFGEDPNAHPDLPVATYLRDHLHVALPAVSTSTGRVDWPALPLADETDGAGRPVRLQIAQGRAPKLPAGVPVPANTLRVRSESVLRLDLAVPVTALAFNGAATALPSTAIDALYFTLAGKLVARSELTVRTPKGAGRLVPRPDARQMALFGPLNGYEGASSSALTRVCAVVEVDLTAAFDRVALVDKLAVELSGVGETCPLPLGADASAFLAAGAARLGKLDRWTLAELQHLAPKVAARCLARGGALPHVRRAFAGLAEVRAARILRGHVFRRRPAARPAHAVDRPPQALGLAYLELPRGTAPLSTRTTVPETLADLPRVAPPGPVARSPLVAALALVVVAPRTRPTDVPVRAGAPARLPARTLAGKRPRFAPGPAGPARRAVLVLDPTAFKGKTGRVGLAALAAGEVCVLDLARADASRPAAFRLRLGGDQHVRVVALDGAGGLLLDRELEPGAQDLALPAGARRLALLGHGASPAPAAREAQPKVGDAVVLEATPVRIRPIREVAPLERPADPPPETNPAPDVGPILDPAVEATVSPKRLKLDPIVEATAAKLDPHGGAAVPPGAATLPPGLTKRATLPPGLTKRLPGAPVAPTDAPAADLPRPGPVPPLEVAPPAEPRPLSPREVARPADLPRPKIPREPEATPIETPLPRPKLPVDAAPAPQETAPVDADPAPKEAAPARPGRFLPRIPADAPRRAADPSRLAARGFSPTTPLVALTARVLLAPGAVVELLDGVHPRRDPLALGAAASLVGRVHRLALHLGALRERGVVTVAVAGAVAAPEALRKIACRLGDQRLALVGALVRGDAALVWCRCEPGARLEVELPERLRLTGVAFWPGVDGPPDDALDRPLLHPRRPHDGAARFTLEVP